MLVLSRRIGEEIVIDGQIRLIVVGVRGKRARLGITAPAGVRINRMEVLKRRNLREPRRRPAISAVNERGGVS